MIILVAPIRIFFKNKIKMFKTQIQGAPTTLVVNGKRYTQKASTHFVITLLGIDFLNKCSVQYDSCLPLEKV